MTKHLPDLSVVAGAASIVYGVVALFGVGVACIVAGVFAVVLGVATDVARRPHPDPKEAGA